MPTSVKMLNNVFDASRTLLAVGTTLTLADDLAAALVGRGDAVDVGAAFVMAPYSGIDRNIIELTQAQINTPTAAILAATNLTFQLSVAPRTRYRSDGTALVSLGGGGGGGTATVNPVPVTTSRNLAATDFTSSLITINSAGVVAITLPTIAAMGLAASAGAVRVLAFFITGGGIPSFAGATSATTINGTAGPATATSLTTIATNGHYVLTQQSVGADAWSLE